jgi:hypothetical protein
LEIAVLATAARSVTDKDGRSRDCKFVSKFVQIEKAAQVRAAFSRDPFFP